MLRTWFLIVGGSLVLATSLTAADDEKKSAQDEKKPAAEPKRGERGNFFEQFDKNKDGFLDRSEVPDRLKERFDQLDTNNDGKLSKEELQKVLSRAGSGTGGRPAAAPADALFRLLDKNGDGKLSKEELQDAPKLIEQLDKNKDGVLSPDELTPVAQSGRRRPGAAGAAPAPGAQPAARRPRP